MAKEITIQLSDKQINELWELENMPIIKRIKKFGGEKIETFEEFYKRNKKPTKALFG
jgi:hypothetical protein